MTSLFDTHAHYNDEKFDVDREQLFADIITPNEVNPFGIGFILNCGTDIQTSRECIGLAEAHSFMRAAVGFHPHEASAYSVEARDEIMRLASSDKVVAIGEIGLDYHYDFSPREVQKQVFSDQLDLAEKLNMPVIIHDREAHGDVMDILSVHKNSFGIFHSYSGSGEMAKQVIKMGFYVSYSGSLTFNSAVNLRESVKYVPLDRLLIETDSPYLAPVPYRGKRNDSSKMYETLKKLAELKEIPIDELAKITSDNAKRIFGMVGA